MGGDDGKKSKEDGLQSDKRATALICFFVTVYLIAVMAGCGASRMSVSAWRNITLSLMIPMVGAILELLHVFSKNYSTEGL